MRVGPLEEFSVLLRRQRDGAPHSPHCTPQEDTVGDARKRPHQDWSLWPCSRSDSHSRATVFAAGANSHTASWTRFEAPVSQAPGIVDRIGPEEGPVRGGEYGTGSQGPVLGHHQWRRPAPE